MPGFSDLDDMLAKAVEMGDYDSYLDHLHLHLPIIMYLQSTEAINHDKWEKWIRAVDDRLYRNLERLRLRFPECSIKNDPGYVRGYVAALVDVHRLNFSEWQIFGFRQRLAFKKMMDRKPAE